MPCTGVQPCAEHGRQAGHHAEAWPGMAVQPGLRKIRVRAPGSQAGGGRGRGTHASRRRSGSAEPSSARRRLEGPASSPMTRSGEAAVGARIGIWWPADEAYYRVGACLPTAVVSCAHSCPALPCCWPYSALSHNIAIWMDQDKTALSVNTLTPPGNRHLLAG